MTTRPVQSILCPVDIERPSDAALRYAYFLAEAFYASLEVVHARTPTSDPLRSLDVGSGARARAEHSLNERFARGRLVGLLQRVTTAVPGRASAHVVEGGPVSGVLRSALRFRSDLIVMGSHFEARSDWLFESSLGEQIAYAAACPVLSVHEGGERMPLLVRNILLTVDFHNPMALATQWTIAFARCFGATVELLSVRRASHLDGEPTQVGEPLKLQELRDRLRAAGVSVDSATACDDGAFERILRRTESGACDLVVMGAEPREKRMSVTQPSLTASIRRHASIPVLSVRPPGSQSALIGRGLKAENAHSEPTSLSMTTQRPPGVERHVGGGVRPLGMRAQTGNA
jgi:nucleotide-binding universal stress UspA family protein